MKNFPDLYTPISAVFNSYISIYNGDNEYIFEDDFERTKLSICDAVKKILEAERQKIHDDLIAIADKGENEELRREVERYFA